MRPILLLLLLGAGAVAGSDQYAQLLEKGQRLVEARKYDEALPVFTEAAQENPADWRGHFWKVVSLLQLAIASDDVHHRYDLLDSAQRSTERMIADTGMFFTDPLPLFLEGITADIRQDHLVAYDRLEKALRTRPSAFRPYAEIELHSRLQRAYAKVCMRLGQALILKGKFTQADDMLGKVKLNLPKNDPAWIDYYREQAIVDEALARYDKAVAGLQKVIALSPDPSTKEGLTGTIARLYIQLEQLDKGKKVLATLPADCQNPEVLSARCAVLKLEATRDPEKKLDEALAYYRKVMAHYPKGIVYRLVLDYGELVLEKVGPADVEKEGSLVKELISMCDRELKLRPECPSLYWLLFRSYKLLGDMDKANRFKKLHDEKAKEIKGKEQYDQFGRPRC